MKAPNSANVNTHGAMVRFLVKVVTNANNLETRIEQLEKDAKKTKKQLTKLIKDAKERDEYNRLVDEYNSGINQENASPPVETEKEKETKNEE